MRSQRMRRYRKKFRHVTLVGKVVLIWYLVVFSLSYITTSDTTADFTNLQEASGMIYAAGDWKVVDESAFKFIEKDSQELNACEKEEIDITLKNNGTENMTDTSTYDVYFSESGNPRKDGKKLKLNDNEGTIPALKVDESTELTFKAIKPGTYIFVTYQLDEDESEVWSEDITITSCESDKETKPKADDKEQSDESKDANKDNSSDKEEKDTTSDDGNEDSTDSSKDDDSKKDKANASDANDATDDEANVSEDETVDEDKSSDNKEDDSSKDKQEGEKDEEK